MRLEKYLSDCGYGTRREMKRNIENGQVTVNEKIIKNSGYAVDEKKDVVYICGKKAEYKKYYYYIMNKPSGYITAREDKSEKTVMEILPEWVNRKDLAPVGRLDKDTEGLLMFTNDGETAHSLLSPKKHIKKTYYCKLLRKIEEEDTERLCNGVIIEEGYLTKNSEIDIISDNEINLTITEGKYHQVKQMLEVVGNRVIYLKRIKFGNYEIGDMEIGEVKEIDIDEII